MLAGQLPFALATAQFKLSTRALTTMLTAQPLSDMAIGSKPFIRVYYAAAGAIEFEISSQRISECMASCFKRASLQVGPWVGYRGMDMNRVLLLLLGHKRASPFLALLNLLLLPDCWCRCLMRIIEVIARQHVGNAFRFSTSPVQSPAKAPHSKQHSWS